MNPGPLTAQVYEMSLFRHMQLLTVLRLQTPLSTAIIVYYAIIICVNNIISMIIMCLAKIYVVESDQLSCTYLLRLGKK